MNTRRVTNIRKDRRTTLNYGDDKASPGVQSRNHFAQSKRPLNKLRELLCKSGTKSNGQACQDCEVPCQFGKEYLSKKREEARE